ncbi:tRNase Z endonuclease [Lasallia pustulata]|uniref:ribonuclease Z n=1 Tax=Lasallia pustulata TaxID=136370 RepID=A0A1W5DDZ3_9LECA|nr:tRNase Z endonuclease [Lasallia pustulata]
MRSYIQFLTTPTADTPGTCLMLHFDDKRYLIGNLHEGTQRASIQRGIKLTKVSEIFLTGKTEWKNTGGLIGMILTLADTTKAAAVNKVHDRALNNRTIENKQRDEATDRQFRGGEDGGEQAKDDRVTLNIHGGSNLMHTLATGRRFVFRKGMPINVDEMDGERVTDLREPTWMDKNVKVWAMSISPSSNAGASSPRAISPRKRSFNEFKDGGSPILEGIADRPNEPEESPAERSDREQQIRKAVVSEMFDSDWRLDALLETWLHQVKMPAALFERDPETRKIVKYTGPLPGESEELPFIKVLVRQPWPAAMIQHLPPTTPSQAAMSYFFRNHPQRGKFNPEAAKALKVEMGPAWAKLASGQSVESNDGKLITSDMVLAEGKEGGGVAVVELPSRDYVHNLIERPEWKSPEVMTGIGAVIWILGAGVGQDDNLRRFMSDFSYLKHFVSSRDYCPNYLSLDSSASAAIRLNQVDPMRYPIPVHDNVTLPQPGQPALPKEPKENIVPAQRGLTIQFQPSFEILTSAVVPPLNTAEVLQETPTAVLALAQTAKEELSSDAVREQMAKQYLPSQDAEIITLGTGSALPSKYRNVSATLLRVPGCGSYLLDCGENTLGQLKRVYPPDELAEVLRDLKLIWISHLHADHHLGTTSVIKAWYQEVYGKQIAEGTLSKHSLTEQLLYPSKILEEERRLFVASEEHMLRYLREYSSVEDFGFDKIVPLAVQASKAGFPESTILRWNARVIGFNTFEPRINRALRASTGLCSLAAVYVDHCYHSMAVTLTFPTGFKFSYSGDCRPCAAFAEIGKGSTVLLHEATFDDELKGDAEAKKHSTTSEALAVGAAMGARRVLLTHFSQRYAKIPVMGDMDGAGEDGGQSEGEGMEGTGMEGTGTEATGMEWTGMEAKGIERTTIEGTSMEGTGGFAGEGGVRE